MKNTEAINNDKNNNGISKGDKGNGNIDKL